MLKYIVTPAAGLAGEETAIRTALAVAKGFDAHVEFVHVRVDVAKVAMSAGVAGLVEPQQEIDAMDAGETESQRAALAAITRLSALAAVPLSTAPGTAGGSAAFSVETGEEADWVTEYGRFADLIVAGRIDDGVNVTVDVAEAALLDSGTPILVAPGHECPVIGGHVVVAWTDTRAAHRAVQAAMPFIERATQVTVVCINADALQLDAAQRLLRALRWHNPATELLEEKMADEFVVTALFDIATRLDARLLVMGGYSHSPLREMLFGGTTKSVMTEAPVPVLMAH